MKNAVTLALRGDGAVFPDPKGPKGTQRDPKGRGKWVVPAPQVDPHEKASHLSDFNVLAQETGGGSLSHTTHLPRPFGFRDTFGFRDGENADSGRKRKLRSTEAGDAGSENSRAARVHTAW